MMTVFCNFFFLLEFILKETPRNRTLSCQRQNTFSRVEFNTELLSVYKYIHVTFSSSGDSLCCKIHISLPNLCDCAMKCQTPTEVQYGATL